MEDFNYDKAFMAVKAQRYDEALNSYEAALKVKYTVEGWTGLGICKLFQLFKDQTMEEVIYCFSKAKEVENCDPNDIDLQLISYSNLVIERATLYCLNLIDEIEKAKAEQTAAIITSGIAMAIASTSNSAFTQIASGTIAGASAGVAVGKFAEIQDSKVAGKLAIDMISQISSGVSNFLVENSKYPEYEAFNKRVNELVSLITEKSSNQKKSLSTGEYNKNTLAVVCFLFGWLGIHRFMTGHVGMGVVMLLTSGGCFILQLIDFINILSGKYKTKDGKLIS